MSIETLDDIIDQTLNRMGVYGAHSNSCTKESPCRCCARADLKSRILTAVEIEIKFGRLS